MGLAQDFIVTYGGPEIMLYDGSFDSWRELGIRGQPAGILFNADGTAVGGWSGGIPEEAVLEAIAELP